MVTRVVTIDGGVNPSLVAQHLGQWFAPQPVAPPESADRERRQADDGDEQRIADDSGRQSSRDERQRRDEGAESRGRNASSQQPGDDD